MRSSLVVTLALGMIAATVGAESRVDPFTLPIGGKADETAAALRQYATVVWRAPQLIASTPALPSILEQQKVILTVDQSTGKISAVHVQILADRGAGTADLLRLHEDVKRILIERFGAPDWEREGRRDEGTPHPATEWRDDASRSHVRAGIPKRMDGRAIVEIAITPRSIPRSELFWGAEDYATRP